MSPFEKGDRVTLNYPGHAWHDMECEVQKLDVGSPTTTKVRPVDKPNSSPYGFYHERLSLVVQVPAVPPTAPDILKHAAEVMAERGKQYDSPQGERSMANIVAAFNIITGQDLTEVQGWEFMQVLKQVRFFQNPKGPAAEDCMTDNVAYAGLQAEAAQRA